MLNIQQQVSLLPFNTLGIDVTADYFVELSDQQNIPECYDFAHQKNLPVLILGGGSNVVLQKNFPGLVIKINLLGMSVAEQRDEVIVTAAAGENWHQLVLWCLQQGYYGIENLALIPGTVGAAPVQNIGAYGVELAKVFSHLSGWNCEQQQWQTLETEDCHFSYRNSIFKTTLKNRFIITDVSLRLSTIPNTETDYAALKSSLDKQHMNSPSPLQVAETVIAIRQSKLPDPAQLANAGSFFKNPIVSNRHLQTLLQSNPDLIYYPQAKGEAKLAAGWLLEKAGWKGYRKGQVGMHQDQALVLINHGDATGREIIAFAELIQQDIKKRFDVDLEIEPELISLV